MQIILALAGLVALLWGGRVILRRVMENLKLSKSELEALVDVIGEGTTGSYLDGLKRGARIGFVFGVLVGRRTCKREQLPAVRLELIPGPITEQDLGPVTTQPRSTHMDLKATQQVPFTIKPVDRKGNPAPIDGVPEWTSSNEAVATVEPSEDGLSAVVKAGVPGDATISVTADADLGEGVTAIAGTADIHVTPGAAVSVALEAGEVTEQE